MHRVIESDIRYRELVAESFVRLTIMLVSNGMYELVPKIWAFMGLLFVFLAVAANGDTQYFCAYPLLSFVCFARWYHINRARKRRLARASACSN